MARKSKSGWFGMALLAVGGYFVYENWANISAWIDTVVPVPTAAPATASGTYPNSPVPTSYSTSQTFVDSSGNQWQFSTQTGAWVIATPGPAPASPSAGTVVSTTVVPQPVVPPVAIAPVTAVPASPGTVVSLPVPPSSGPSTGYVLDQPNSHIVIARATPINATQPVATPVQAIYGMPHYRGY